MADNRGKACKAFLSWFLGGRGLKHLIGRLNTFTLINNSAETIVIDESGAINPVFQNIRI